MKHCMSIHVNIEVIDTVLVWFSWTSVPGNFSCVANKTTECRAGTYAGVGSSECRPCPKGAFCPNNGLSSYFLCANTTYADEENLVTCKQCDAGFQCPSVGMQAPEECSNGTYSNSTGARYCILCPEGHRWVYASCAINSFILYSLSSASTGCHRGGQHISFFWNILSYFV